VSPEIVVAIIVLLAIGIGVAWWLMQRRRSERLRTRFGPEYERTVEKTDDQRKAEAELEARAERVDALEIRRLSAADRARFGERWRIVQGLFVDDPSTAVEQADGLIGEVMNARGYPVGDFEQRAADVSVNHPNVVDHYRTAHHIAEQRLTGRVDTERLRQAFVHYRALFAELLETDTPAERSTAEMTPAETSTAEREARPADMPADEAANTAATAEPAEPARRP
jgi:hypothetical protein